LIADISRGRFAFYTAPGVLPTLQVSTTQAKTEDSKRLDKYTVKKAGFTELGSVAPWIVLFE